MRRKKSIDIEYGESIHSVTPIGIESSPAGSQRKASITERGGRLRSDENRRHKIRRPLAILVALSLLASAPACINIEQNNWILTGAAIAVALMSSGDDDDDDDGNGDGNGGDPTKPGAPANLTAIPGGEQVTLSWDDPDDCGNGNLCSETDHQHWLEYKLASADTWGNGAVVASDPHADTHTVTGLTDDTAYDFRLAVQLTGADDRGPWAEVSSQAIANDRDGDGVLNDVDAFPDDACASVDTDGDGQPDTLIDPDDSASDACITASSLTEDDDDDGDGILDVDDEDRDNNGLIEIYSLEQLDRVRYDLDGDGSADDSADQAAYEEAGLGGGGCPTEGCNGYELTQDFDFSNPDHYASGEVSTEWTSGSGWRPIGNPDIEIPEDWITRNAYVGDAYTGIFEGNGFTISNLYIRYGPAHTVGLFGELDGEVRNLALENVDIRFSDDEADPLDYYQTHIYVGAIAGRSHPLGSSRASGSEGRVINCSVDGGEIHGGYVVGGLVGVNGGIIANSYVGPALRIVQAPARLGGGIAGSQGSDSWMRNSYSLAVIKTLGGVYIPYSGIGTSLSPGSGTYIPGVAGGLVAYNFGGSLYNNFVDVKPEAEQEKTDLVPSPTHYFFRRVVGLNFDNTTSPPGTEYGMLQNILWLKEAGDEVNANFSGLFGDDPNLNADGTEKAGHILEIDAVGLEALTEASSRWCEPYDIDGDGSADESSVRYDSNGDGAIDSSDECVWDFGAASERPALRPVPVSLEEQRSL